MLRAKNPDILRKAEEAELKRRKHEDERRDAERRAKEEAEKKVLGASAPHICAFQS